MNLSASFNHLIGVFQDSNATQVCSGSSTARVAASETICFLRGSATVVGVGAVDRSTLLSPHWAEVHPPRMRLLLLLPILISL
uniref:Uncharacterized protein n=1 Tax=Physcomitrium patens TaxID=3218 RepID=A0A2K1IJL7_PHYPA|nr:hypothetical protein PHYPA_028160 [Physcomitrium patens]